MNLSATLQSNKYAPPHRRDRDGGIRNKYFSYGTTDTEQQQLEQGSENGKHLTWERDRGMFTLPTR